MTGCRGHVVNTMVCWSTDGRFLKHWIYFWGYITYCIATGVLEIRFEQYNVQYSSTSGHHAGTDPAAVSMASNQVWEEVTASTPSSSSNVTTVAPHIPDAWHNTPSCTSPTRYRFLMCMDLVDRAERCALGREDTGLVQVSQGMIGPNGGGNDIVVFGDMLRGGQLPLMNPIRYNFPTWPGSIQVNMYVQCCGATDTERCEEKLSGNMVAIPVAGQANTPTRVNITSKGSAALTLAVTVRCNTNFYGVNCSTFCRNDNQRNGRVCHPLTGQLVCRPGFNGADCNEDLNECDLGVCRHGAGCNNVHGTFTCHCLRGSSGRLCEVRTPACPSNPCINGGSCEENMRSVDYICHCAVGWKGQRCEIEDPVTTTTTSSTGHTQVMSQGKPETSRESDDDWTIWYVGIALLALTVIVIIILIICVVWSSRRRRYHISELAKADAAISPPSTPSPQTQFDNVVYLHDPEDINLQPASSNLYQRTLVPDDPYMNERPLYQDRITPDVPYDEDICVNRRPTVSSGRDNVYSTWGSVSQPDQSYEAVNVSGRAQEQQPKDIMPTSDTSPTYRRASDPVPYSIFDFDFRDPNFPGDGVFKTESPPVPPSPNNGDIKPESPQYERLLAFFPKTSTPDNPGTQPAANPLYDHHVPIPIQTDRRPSAVSSSVSMDSRRSSQPSQNIQPDRRPSAVSSSVSMDSQSSQAQQEKQTYRRASAVYNPLSMDSLKSLPQHDIKTDHRPSTVSSYMPMECQRSSKTNQELETDGRPSAVYNPLSMERWKSSSPHEVQTDRRESTVSSSLSMDSRRSSQPYQEIQTDRRPSAISSSLSMDSWRSSWQEIQTDRRPSAISGSISMDSRRSSDTYQEIQPDRLSINMGLETADAVSNPMLIDRRSPQPQQDTSIPADVLTYANRDDLALSEMNRPDTDKVHAPNASIKRPCPTPRTSILVTEDPPPSSRKSSDVSPPPYTGKRRKSGDILARTTSGSLQPDWPAENSRTKTGSYSLNT